LHAFYIIPSYDIEIYVQIQPLIVLQHVMCIAVSAGTFGAVSVEWFIDSALTTAIRGTDYITDGATMMFQPHEKLKGQS